MNSKVNNHGWRGNGVLGSTAVDSPKGQLNLERESYEARHINSHCIGWVETEPCRISLSHRWARTWLYQICPS